MKYKTRHAKLLSVPQRWHNQYAACGSDEQKLIAKKLLAIPKSELTEIAINELIGNFSWTSFCCDECEQEVDATISFEKAYDSDGFAVCRDCLLRASRIIDIEKDANQ